MSAWKDEDDNKFRLKEFKPASNTGSGGLMPMPTHYDLRTNLRKAPNIDVKDVDDGSNYREHYNSHDMAVHKRGPSRQHVMNSIKAAAGVAFNGGIQEVGDPYRDSYAPELARLNQGNPQSDFRRVMIRQQGNDDEDAGAPRRAPRQTARPRAFQSYKSNYEPKENVLARPSPIEGN